MAEEQSKSPSSGNNEKPAADPPTDRDSSVSANTVKHEDVISLPEVSEEKTSSTSSTNAKIDEISESVEDAAELVETIEDNSLLKDSSSPEVMKSSDVKPEVSKKIAEDSTKDSCAIVEQDTAAYKIDTEISEELRSPSELSKEGNGTNAAVENETKQTRETSIGKDDEVVEETIVVERKIDEDEEDEDEEVVEEDIEETEEEYRPQEVSEVGIVGPPTAVRDLVNEEELGTAESSSLPNETRNDEGCSSGNNRGPDVAEWIERHSSKNDNSVKITKKNGEKSSKSRKKSFTDIASSSMAPTRKSQRIITSIIRRSIKW